MKKCPTCERTFEDSMRFCQSDGTPLVDDTPVDPYKTMVARPEDIAAAIPPSSDAPVAETPKEDEVLELPVESDPLRTMYASEEEIRKEMNAHDVKDEVVMDIPPLAPEPPRFSEPNLSPPSFTDPPPSPFASSSGSRSESPVESPFSKTTPPIPSPFDPKPSTYEPPAPNFPEFKDPDPVVSNAASNPFDPPASSAQAWTPPAAIEPSMQNQGFDPKPPASGASGLNKTLPIVSLVAGIVSLCCWLSPVTGIVALVTGYLGMKNVNNDPNSYGGKGLAIAGMVTGGILFVVGLAYWIFIIFFNGLAYLIQLAQ